MSSAFGRPVFASADAAGGLAVREVVPAVGAEASAADNQRKFMDKLNNWSFRVKKAWIYGLFRVKTTINQRFLGRK